MSFFQGCHDKVFINKSLYNPRFAGFLSFSTKWSVGHTGVGDSESLLEMIGITTILRKAVCMNVVQPVLGW